MFCLKQIIILAAGRFQSKLSEDHRISRHSLASDCRLWLCSKSSYEECVYVCCHGSARLPVTIWGVSSILENIYILIQSKPKTYCNNVYVLWFFSQKLTNRCENSWVYEYRCWNIKQSFARSASLIQPVSAAYWKKAMSFSAGTPIFKSFLLDYYL